jgi:hypothetical protein
MTDKRDQDEARREGKLDDEALNADGQSARLLTNPTGEFSLDRAREGFDKAHVKSDRMVSKEDEEDG